MTPKSKSIISRIMEFWQLILLVLGILAAWYNMQTKVAVQQVQINAQQKQIDEIKSEAQEKSKALWQAISRKEDKQ